MKKNNNQNRPIAKEVDLTSGVMGKYSFINRNFQALKDVSEIAKPVRFEAFKIFTSKKIALSGTIILIGILILSLIIPFFTVDPAHVDPYRAHLKPFQAGALFGTDYLGRDIWARMWWGIRFSFGMSAVVVLVDLIVGYVFGILMGYFIIFDRIGQFFIKILSNIPVIIILVLLTLVLRPNFWTIILGVTITGWIPMANQVRAYTLKTKQDDWVIASKTIGTPKWKIVFFKFTPHLIPIVTTQLVFTIQAALTADLILAVLGLAIPNTATLGSLLMAGQRFVLVYPMEVILPVIFITLILVSVQFIGNGLRETFKREK